MHKIFLLLATIIAAFTWASDSSPQVIERALPSNIATDLDTISEDLHSLMDTVNAFQGGVLECVAIGKPERVLIKDLKSATANADKLDDMGEGDAQDILASIKGLIPDIDGALGAINKKEPQFRKAGMEKQAASHLTDLQSVVKGYGNSLLAHCPGSTIDEGKDVLAKIMDMFTHTIAQFQ